MIETPCSNCDLDLKRKDCTDKEFNECMAIFYMKKIGYNQIAEILKDNLTAYEFKLTAIAMINEIE